jgi:hypothetical protein
MDKRPGPMALLFWRQDEHIFVPVTRGQTHSKHHLSN